MSYYFGTNRSYLPKIIVAHHPDSHEPVYFLFCIYNMIKYISFSFNVKNKTKGRKEWLKTLPYTSLFSLLFGSKTKTYFCPQDIDEGVVFERPNIYCHFAGGIGEPKYMPIMNWDQLNKLLTEAMASYNDLIAAMNLVLFEDAMMHICR